MKRTPFFSGDERYGMLIVGIYAAKALGYVYINIMGDSIVFQIVSKLLQMIILLFALKSLLKTPCALFLAECMFSMMYFVSLVHGLADRNALLRDWLYGSCLYIPMAFASFRIKDKGLLYRYFYRVSQITFPLLILTILVKHVNGNSLYDMYFGYMMLFPVLLFLASFFRNCGLFDLFAAGSGTVAILLYGSRGPLLCIIVFIILILVFTQEMRMRWKVFLTMLGGLVLSVMGLFMDQVLRLLIRLADALNVNSRSLYLMLAGEAVSHDSGRSIIAKQSIELLNRSPVLGCGVGAAQNMIGSYPHNIFIEFSVNYGYLIGFGAGAILLFIWVRGLLNKNKNTRKMCIIFIAICMQLLVSGTFLGTWEFFVCIGLCLSGDSRPVWVKKLDGEEKRICNFEIYKNSIKY